MTPKKRWQEMKELFDELADEKQLELEEVS